jgi:ligand-binding sensor domain-containing protein
MIITSFEDRNRFLWISTEQGVYRYDGENLVLYLRLAMTESSGQILEDHKGQIWITTGKNNDGIYIINQKAGVAKHLTVSGGLFSNINLRMTTDPKGRIWISSGSDQDSSETGINIIDENSNTIRRFGQAQGLSVSNTLRVYSDNENKIWITSATAGINIIDLEKR